MHKQQKREKIIDPALEFPLVSSIFSLSQAVEGEDNDNSYVQTGHDLIAILFSKSVGIKDINLLNSKYSCNVMV